MGGSKKDHYDEGTTVWVRDPELAWVRGVIVEKRGSTVKVKTDRRTVVEAQLDDVEYCSTTEKQEVKVNDLTQLPDLHHAALLNTLHTRFNADLIYTFTGQILIAVNPFKRIRGLYEPRNMGGYLNASVAETALMDPHAYRVAGAAYEAMETFGGRNQSILVSGESGAGKTYNTKVLLSYLTVAASGDVERGLAELRASMKRGSRKTTVGASVAQRILEANPLMEAFGNAKTLRNDNSSRFGKLIELDFEPQSSRLMGASIDVYLLEKARVVHQQEGERGFHIFYEMAAGLSSDERRALGFPDVRACRYIKSRTMQRADIDDVTQWKITRGAFDVLGFSHDERDQVLRVMAAVLHLGNVEFSAHNKDGADASKVASSARESVDMCAELLGVPSKELLQALTTRGINAGGMGAAGSFLANLTGGADAARALGGEALTKQHTVQQAEEARDALAMALYERTFGWIVWRINEAIGVSSKTGGKAGGSRPKSRAAGAAQKRAGTGKGAMPSEPDFYNDFSIGVLDIFGFEVFEANGFEQLLINYCNERLQGQFNDHIFRLEAAIFQSEGLDWASIDWPDNQLTLDMIEARPIGLLALIDEQCLYPQGTDASLASKLYQNLAKGPFATVFAADRNRQVRRQFEVSHFAGVVTYTADGFCAKNKNELRQEAVDLTRVSSDPWLAVLLPPDASAAGGGADSQEYFSQMASKPKNLRSSLQRHRHVSPRTTRLQQKTVSAHFRTQLSVALDHINASQPHYIRCIKPNDLNVEAAFDRLRVEEQLAYSGVLEVVRVARAGYPTRFLLKDFAERFFVLLHDAAASSGAASGSRRRSKSKGKRRSKNRGGNAASAFGDFRAQCERILSNSKLEHVAEYQVGRTRVFLKPYAYTTLEVLKAERILRHVLVLQRNIRVFLRTYRATKKVRAAKMLQRNVRGFLVRNEYHAFRSERKAAVAIQRVARGMLARAHVAPLLAQRLANDEAAREAAAARIKKAYRRKVLKDRLREIKEESVRQRSAVMLQSLARVIRAQKMANGLYAKRVADDTARALQAAARALAAKKTREMLEQEREEEEEEDPNYFMLYAGPLLVLFLFTQPVLMLTLSGVAVAMMAGAGMALEAEERQKLFDRYGMSYTRRTRRHQRRRGAQRQRGFSDDGGEEEEEELDGFSDSELDDGDEAGEDLDEDLAFYEGHKGASRKLSQQLSKTKTKRAGSKAPARPAASASARAGGRRAAASSVSGGKKKLPPPRRGISSRRVKANAFDDFDDFYAGGERPGKKKSNAKASPRRFRALHLV